MADSERIADESGTDYASSEWLWCCGQPEPESDGKMPEDRQMAKREGHGEGICKPKEADSRYGKSNKNPEAWRKKEKKKTNKENEQPWDSSALTSYESKNHYLVRQNHDSKSINGESFHLISKLREARNQLVREGEIRHRAFKEAHTSIARKSESKKREMSMISTEELKYLIVDKIIKSQRKQDYSRTGLEADLNNNSKEKSFVNRGCDSKANHDFRHQYKDDTFVRMETSEGATIFDKEDNSSRKVLSELQMGTQLTEKEGRDINIDEICYTKSKVGMTDREGFMMTMDDRQEWRAPVSNRHDQLPTGPTAPQGDAVYKQMMFYESDECLENEADFKVDEYFEGIPFDQSKPEITPEEQVDDNLQGPYYENSQEGTNCKKTESSFDRKINEEFRRYQDMEYASEAPHPEVQTSHPYDQNLEVSEQKSKSARSRVLMDNFALKMDLINKKLEALKATTELESITTRLVDLEGETEREPSHEHEVRAVQLSYNSIKSAPKEYVLIENSLLEPGVSADNDLYADFKRSSHQNIEYSNHNQARRVSHDEEEPQETRQIVTSGKKYTQVLRTSELMINTIMETYEETSSLRGEDPSAKRHVSVTKSMITEKESEGKFELQKCEFSEQKSLYLWNMDSIQILDYMPIYPTMAIAKIERTYYRPAPVFSRELGKNCIEAKFLFKTLEAFEWKKPEKVWPRVAIEPAHAGIEHAYSFGHGHQALFNNTMSSSQLMFDNQAEIFGLEEANEEPLFQGFLNADCLVEDLERDRVSACFDKKQLSQTKKLVKRYAPESHTGKASRRFSGSRYTLNVSKGQLRQFAAIAHDDDSILAIKRTLNLEFDQAEVEKSESSILEEIRQRSLQELRPKQDFNASLGMSHDQREDRAKLDTVREETTGSKPLNKRVTSITVSISQPEESPQKISNINAETKEAISTEQQAYHRSVNQSKSSIKKGLYKLMASSKKVADISDYLYIDKQLNCEGRLTEAPCDPRTAEHQGSEEPIDPQLIIQELQMAVCEKFDPMKSHEFSSYYDKTHPTDKKGTLRKSFERIELANKHLTETRISATHSLTQTGQENDLIGQNNIAEINKKFEEIKLSINSVGITALNLFNTKAIIRVSAALTDHKRYSSNSLNQNRRPTGFEGTEDLSGERALNSSSHSKQKKPQFTAFERWYAKEKNISIDNLSSKQEFRNICLESSMKDRELRAQKIILSNNEEQDKASVDRSESQNESQISGNDQDAKYIAELLPVFTQPSEFGESTFRLASNALTSTLLMLLNFERESNKIIRLLQICPGFNARGFIESCFNCLGRISYLGSHMILSKNSAFKLIKSFGSSCPLKVFDSYWGVKFGKACITKTQFAEEFFHLELPNDDESEPEVQNTSSISSYSCTLRSLLALLFDLSIKGEIYFQREKPKISLPSILAFTRQVCQNEKGSVAVADLAKQACFSEFSRAEFEVITRRLFRATKSDQLSAYNLCIMVA
jgi:hypothetical protein